MLAEGPAFLPPPQRRGYPAGKRMKNIIQQDLSLEARKAEKERLKEASQPIYEEERAARIDERKAYAVYIVASENVAKAGANLLFTHIVNDRKVQDTPIHHKKFKAFAESVLGEDLVVSTSNGLFVTYRFGIYGFDKADVCPIKDGKITITDTTAPHHVATYDEIVEEINRAALYFDKITNAIDDLYAREKAEHEAYRTGARRLLPSIACTPLYLDYDFTRAAY